MIGTGTTLTYGANAWSDNLLELSWAGMKRKAIETSSMGTTPLTSNATQFGSETWVPSSLTDPGVLKFKIQLDPDHIPKIDESAKSFFLVYPNQTMWSGSGFIQSAEFSDPDTEIMTGTYEVKISGNVNVNTFTAGGVLNDVGVVCVNDAGVIVYA